MNNDSQRLAEALGEYLQALERKAAVLRGELDPLKRSWTAFSTVYEGSAADHFRAGWLRTEQMLEDYLATSARLQPILRERLDALRDAARPGPE